MTHTDPMTLGDEAFLSRARHMCESKAAYISRREARTFLSKHDYPGEVYKCALCGHYHHTTYCSRRSKAFAKRLKNCLYSFIQPH